jgi:hypothetical protein
MNMALAVLLAVVPVPSRVTKAFATATPIEIVEVKVMGISAVDQAKSIIQIKWVAEAHPGITIKSFDISLEVAYADGAIEKVKSMVNGSARSARFELPTVHLAAGRAAAELRNFKATVTANSAETSTKTGAL